MADEKWLCTELRSGARKWWRIRLNEFGFLVIEDWGFSGKEMVARILLEPSELVPVYAWARELLESAGWLSEKSE